jgi:hypothetical protein
MSADEYQGLSDCAFDDNQWWLDSVMRTGAGARPRRSDDLLRTEARPLKPSAFSTDVPDVRFR